jgi:3-oxoacyl-[acyl-carrier-protein] synthase-3
MPTGILATEYKLGDVTLSYEDLELRFGAETMRRVFGGSRIRTRRVAPRGVCGSDLAFEAATMLFRNHAIDRSTIDLLIHCTQSPDYFLPTTACILHQRLGLKTGCACFDINMGCSQYVYALSVAHSMISAGVATRALVLTGDTLTQTIHPLDRSLAPLMADGGSATLVAPVPDGQGFLGFELGTDGTGHKCIIMPAGGFRIPISPDTAIETTDADGNVRSPQNLFMDGPAVFHFALWVVPKTVQALLARLGFAHDQIDLFLFHQANKFMLECLQKKLRIPNERTYSFLEDIGNTSGTTMPIVIKEAMNAGKISPGSLVLMVVFGVGLSWAGTLVRWPDPVEL